jgi:DNA-binding NarL/FixJ family response regulator
MGDQECEYCRRLSASTMSDPATGSRVQALTRREREVWLLVGVGLSNADIAQALFVTESTVKKHVAATVRKLGASGRVEASQLAALWHQATCPVAARTAGVENWSRRTIAGRMAA